MSVEKSVRRLGLVWGSGVFLERLYMLLRISSASPSGTPVGCGELSGNTEPLVGEMGPTSCALCWVVVAATGPRTY